MITLNDKEIIHFAKNEVMRWLGSYFDLNILPEIEAEIEINAEGIRQVVFRGSCGGGHLEPVSADLSMILLRTEEALSTVAVEIREKII